MKRSLLHRAALIAGGTAFVLFEGAVAYAAIMVSAVRCCGQAGGAWPQNPVEWCAVTLLVATMLLLGAVVGLAVTLIVEAIERIVRLARARSS